MIERLLQNWPLKLLALGLSFAIWVAVTGENRIVQDVRVPLDIQVRDDLILTGSPPTDVTVRLRGTETSLRRADTGLVFRVDLRDALPGPRRVPLAKEGLRGVPADVEVERIDPDRVSLKVDRRLRRALPVVPAFLGKPPKGFAFYGAEVTPDALEVEGPEAEVAGLGRLRTDPIRLDAQTAPFVARVSAVPESREGRIVDPKPVEVRVDVDVTPAEAGFDDVPVVLAGQAFEAFASPSRVRVVLAGPPALLATIRPAQIRAVADVSALQPSAGAYQVPLRVVLLDVPALNLGRIAIKSVSHAKVSIRLLNRRVSR